MEILPEELSKVYEQAAIRLAGKHELADKTYEHVADNTIRYLDDDERIGKRIERLLKNPLVEKSFSEQGVSDELRRAKSFDDLSPEAHSALERVLEGSDFMPTWFLARGAELRRTVARIRARTAGGKDLKGTGFLVGPRLLLTNAHVLDWSDIGKESLSQIVPHSLAEFDYEEQFNGAMQTVATFSMDPATLLLTSRWDQLDYALVALRPQNNEGSVSIDSYGYNRLAGDLGKIAKGEPVFIIQHPNGQPKQVVVQNNRLIDRDEEVPYLTYEADTDQGSSGSPVYNRQWEVVALHHSTEMDRNAAGKILAKDGSVWQPGMGTGQIKLLNLNEGVRISKILVDLVTKLHNLKDNGLNAINPPETCTASGLELLTVALETNLNVAPSSLIQPIPIENKPKVASATSKSGGFSSPD